MAELVGSNIDPRLFLQDYSGFVDAGRTNANAFSGLGESISGMVKDYAKEQKDAKNKLKTSQIQIDAAIKLFPDQAPYLSGIANELKNEDAPLSDRAAMASQVADLIQMGVGQKRYETELGFKQRDQAIQERESGMRMQANEMQIAEAQRGFQDAETKRQVNAAFGPSAMDSALGMLGKSDPKMADSIREAARNFAPEDQLVVADLAMLRVPKQERAKAPQIVTIQLPDGSAQQAQWDETLGTHIPIQTAGIATSQPEASAAQDGYRDLPSDQNAGPGLFPPADPNDPAPPSSLPMPIGYSPPPSQTISPMDAQKMDIQKKEFDAAQVEKANAKSATIAKSSEMLLALEKLENHPGFSNLFGINIGVPTWIPGSSGADAKALFKQIEGKGFIESIQAMKGMGALSNAEGEKASISYLGITPSMSEGAAKARIKELKELVAQGIQRINTGNLTNPDGSPMVNPRMTDAERLRAKLGN